MDRSLPKVAAYSHPVSGDMIFVMVGRTGYWPKTTLGIVDDDLTAEAWNEAHDISKGEAEAMFAGSMWGWDVPAAKASNYTRDGAPLFNKVLDD